MGGKEGGGERGLGAHTTFFLSSEDDCLRSLCSEGDLGGLLPGEPREEGGLVEGLGEGSGPGDTNPPKKNVDHL